jgi:hypothetical protein
VAAVFPSEEFAAVAQIRLRRFQAREAGRLRLTPPGPGEAVDRYVLSGPIYRDDLASVRTTVNMLQGRLVVVTT